METEIWKDVVGYEGFYQVSSFGRVKSVARIIKKSDCHQKVSSKILTNLNHSFGYKSVNLTNTLTIRMHFVHRLVASAFIKNPKNKPTVNHKNGIKSDNRVENLEWSTFLENNQHAIDVLNKKSRLGIKNGYGI